MAIPDSIALAAHAESQGIPMVLVGGNAINLHAYFRATFDVDLLIRETDVERALAFFRQHGYEIFHRTANFARLHFAADPAAALPVDLMLADDATFEKIRQQSRRCDLGNGLTLPIPSALHLIAMGSNENSASNRALEGTGDLALPEFHTLPAAAGLSNTDAFRLSLRHALALWPRLYSQHRISVIEQRVPERFSLAWSAQIRFARETLARKESRAVCLALSGPLHPPSSILDLPCPARHSPATP